MSRQKAAGSRGDTALSAIKRYVGGGDCYHQFPRMSLLGNSVNRGNLPIDSFVICGHGATSQQAREAALYDEAYLCGSGDNCTYGGDACGFRPASFRRPDAHHAKLRGRTAYGCIKRERLKERRKLLEAR